MQHVRIELGSKPCLTEFDLGRKSFTFSVQYYFKWHLNLTKLAMKCGWHKSLTELPALVYMHIKGLVQNYCYLILYNKLQ